MTPSPSHATEINIAGIAPADLTLDDQLFASLCRDPNINSMVSAGAGQDGFVYVVAPADQKVCKIGSTDFMVGRLSGLQSGYWARLQCVAAVAVFGARRLDLELAAHRAAGAMAPRLVGEWFAMEPQQAIEAVVLAARQRGIRIECVAALQHTVEEANRARVQEIESQRRAQLQRKLGMV